MERLLQIHPKVNEAVQNLIKRNFMLTAAEKQNRLNFAFVNENRDWSNVVFCDEIKFGNVGIWAAIDLNGPCKMRFFDGRFSSQRYISILNECILPLHNEKNDMILMQVSNLMIFQLNKTEKIKVMTSHN